MLLQIAAKCAANAPESMFFPSFRMSNISSWARIIPEGSSEARLIRLPVAKRSSERSILDCALRRAFIAKLGSNPSLVMAFLGARKPPTVLPISASENSRLNRSEPVYVFGLAFGKLRRRRTSCEVADAAHPD